MILKRAVGVICIAISLCFSVVAWQSRAQAISQASVRRADSVIKEDWEQDKWVMECLDQMRSIRVGMTRADLMKVFGGWGGLHKYPTPTFEYRGCRYFKVDVTFKFKAHDEQGRAIEKPDDVIQSISKPYLGDVYVD